jgi:dipeptidyl-peptidase-4
MIIRSDRDGYNHLYKYNWANSHITDLTNGDFDVDALVGVDKVNKLVYYTAAETSPLQRNLYVVGWNGYGHECLTPEKGMHSITPCEGYNYFLDKYSTLNKVPVYYLRNAKGKIIRTLEDNKALESKMGEYALGNISFMKVQGVNNTLNAWMITPPDFDKTKKYPVLMYQYSGPGSQEVADRFPLGNFWWHQMLAQKGYIIICADGTGTGFRGEAFSKKTYLQLGKYESEDQIAVARYIGDLPYVDKKRIGIWGWSYGGFMSSTCIMKGNDVFKAAIAVAPVTNWRFYDNIYTERYMRTPQENASGYDDNSPEKMVDKLKGKFLYIHGTADDNVHFQNSAMMTTALIIANKDYDSEYYPDKAHGISGGNTRLHLYRRMTNFILENL